MPRVAPTKANLYATLVALTAATLVGCTTNALQPQLPPPPVPMPADRPMATSSIGTRTAPVVPGRPGRVFIFAGLENDCRPAQAPTLTITTKPGKGDISFKPNQTTTIATSQSGNCHNVKATGTGVYYTAHNGTTGPDTFAITARLASGETMTKTFRVTIAE